MNELWQQYTEWLSKNIPEQYKLLNGPATSDDFTAFEKTVGYSFPASLRDLYEINNGTHDGDGIGGSLWNGYEFLSIRQITDNWIANKEVIDDIYPSTGSSYPEDAIKTAYYNINWVPFLHDGSGNYIGIDLDPGVAGKSGQVINFGSDEIHQHVIANSLEDFVAIILRQIQSGNVKIEDSDWYFIDYDYVQYGFHLDIVEYGPQTTKIFFVPDIQVITGDGQFKLDADWAGRVLPGQTLSEGISAEVKEVYGYSGRLEVGNVLFLDHAKDNKGNDIQRYKITIRLYPNDTDRLPTA
jgi:cell wall assembly regulator SMI1